MEKVQQVHKWTKTDNEGRTVIHWCPIILHIKTIEAYCVKCEKNAKSKTSDAKKSKQKRLTLLSSCIVCCKKKLKFIQNWWASKLELFQKLIWNDCFKMKIIFKKFLLAGDKFTQQSHLRQPRFIHSAWGLFNKHCERIKKFRETGDLKHSLRKKLGKGCLACNAAYSDCKDLAKRTFQVRFWIIELMKLLEILNIIDSKEN